MTKLVLVISLIIVWALLMIAVIGYFVVKVKLDSYKKQVTEWANGLSQFLKQHVHTIEQQQQIIQNGLTTIIDKESVVLSENQVQEIAQAVYNLEHKKEKERLELIDRLSKESSHVL